jgi:hypothetical protein
MFLDKHCLPEILAGKMDMEDDDLDWWWLDLGGKGKGKDKRKDKGKNKDKEKEKDSDSEEELVSWEWARDVLGGELTARIQAVLEGTDAMVEAYGGVE